MTARKNRIFPLLVITGIILILLILGFLWFFTPHTSPKDEDLDRLTGESYSAVFLSMYDISSYSEEDFAVYRGLTTVKYDAAIPDLKTLDRYLKAAFSSPNHLEEIYLGLDPAALFAGSKDLAAELRETLLFYAGDHPECTFEIMLPYPSLEKVKKETAQALEKDRAAYTEFAELFAGFSNCRLFYVGGEEWLIANPANYIGEDAVNAHTAGKLFLLTFCDGAYETNAASVGELIDRRNALLSKKYTDADLSDRTYVFFGDSIFGNYTGSTSVPGVINGLSGAKVYNLAKGGATGADYHDAPANFAAMAQAFKDGDTEFLAGEQCASELAAFLADAPEGDLCFVINFGLNDYFNGTPLTGERSYEEGLVKGIQILQEARPDADILLAAPTFCATFSNGTEINSSEGGVLRDYADKALEIAEELHIRAVDPYAELGVNEANSEDYLADETHFNEAGRFLFGEYLTEKLAE